MGAPCSCKSLGVLLPGILSYTREHDYSTRAVPLTGQIRVANNGRVWTDISMQPGIDFLMGHPQVS